MEILYQQNTCMYKHTETNPDVSGIVTIHQIFLNFKLDMSHKRLYITWAKIYNMLLVLIVLRHTINIHAYNHVDVIRVHVYYAVHVWLWRYN